MAETDTVALLLSEFRPASPEERAIAREYEDDLKAHGAEEVVVLDEGELDGPSVELWADTEKLLSKAGQRYTELCKTVQ